MSTSVGFSEEPTFCLSAQLQCTHLRFNLLQLSMQVAQSTASCYWSPHHPKSSSLGEDRQGGKPPSPSALPT